MPASVCVHVATLLSIFIHKRRNRRIEGKHKLTKAKTMDESSIKLALPGFRFHPTEEELLNFYLKNTILGKKLHYHVIGILNIYRHDPWFLPGTDYFLPSLCIIIYTNEYYYLPS